MLLTVSSFLIVTALVAYVSWLRTKNDDLTTSKGYFLAGRGLSGIVIGCSMVLTSLSTEQLIGVNAVSYQNNFSVIAWTVPTVIPLCFLALYMLPKYLRNGYTTIPEFFENRFDRQTRLIMSGLFLVFYLLIVIPTALYTGAIAFNKIFNLETIFGLSYAQAIVYTVIAIGVVGAIYAIFGGLKAVAVSDTINAVILVIGALLVPVFALLYLGNGSISEGLHIITTTHVEKWNAIGSSTDSTPWPTIFTGIMVVHFFYWTTNQAIVQRCLGAKDLASGQKGILIAALFLLTLPIILNLPGLLSFHILGEGLNPIDTSYPLLVNKVMPTALQGFFIAALFGAILSTFNSFLNSAATIYCKDLLPSISKKQRTDQELIVYAKKVSTIMAIVTMIIGPLLMFGTDGIFLITKRFAGFVNIPIVALFAVAELFVMPYIGSFVSNSDPKSISATRENPELQPLPFYHSKDEVLRIELVYEAHKKIGDMDLTNKEEIIKALPFVLISQKPAELLIPDSIRKDLNLRFIDCYDNNRWAKGHKRYDSVFISNVTIVEPIKEQ